MDIASNTFSSRADDVAPPLVERHTLIWGSFLVGLVIGFVAVYIVAAQPMFAQLRSLQRQTQALQSEVQTLVGVRDQAWEAGNLLSDLTALRGQLADARTTVREIRQLRQDLLDEARHTSAASAAIGGLGRLQDSVLERQELTAQAGSVVEEFGKVLSRLVEEHVGTTPANETLADIARVRSDLAELVQLKRQVTDGAENVTAAKSAAGELVSLKDQIAEQGANTEAARTQANRMFVLQDELKAHAGDSPAAFDNLDRLLSIKDKLVEQTPQVVDAVQNLEILSDFQEELDTQIRSLARMREGLTEFILLETTIGRVVKALEPLTQIANVRRLGDHELRAAAKAILDNRTTRLSSKPASPRELPTATDNDPFQMTEEGSLLRDIPRDLGADDSLRIPDPVPLPTTEQPAAGL